MSRTHNINDTHLLSLIGKHDQQAFDLLYDLYGGQLYGAISRSIACSTTANLIFREILEDIWKQIDGFNPEKEQLLYWLMNVVRKSLATYHQNNPASAKGRFPYATSASNTKLINAVQDAGTFSITTLRDSDASSLTALSEQQRAILLAAYYRGANMTEMASLLNMSPMCVKKLLPLFFATLKKN